MIKFIHALSKQKLFIILVLCLPLLALFFKGRFELDILPDNPNPRFQVGFDVPHRLASEIVARVTEPAEKVFNGLPSLLSMKSKTTDHKVEIELIFKDSIKGQAAYLYVQEKLDLIRLQVPRDVESINVTRIEKKSEADIRFNFKKSISIITLGEALGPIRSGIARSNPDLNQEVQVVVTPKIELMAKEGISLTQITETMKLTGISTALGKQGGILFGIGRSYQSIEELKAAVVAAKGNRPLSLKDVASIEIATPPTTQSIDLWIDEGRVSHAEVKKHIDAITDTTGIGIEYTSKRPAFRLMASYLVQPIIGFLFIIFLQVAFFQRVFGSYFKLRLLMIFDSLIILHFIFWRGLVAGGLSVIDLHALLLTLIVGTAFWIVLFSRIRSYFLADLKIKKIPKSIEQSNLFALGELFPTFVLLSTVFYLLNLPVLLSGINNPSQYFLNSFIGTGLPVMMALLVLMPLLTDYAWILDSQKVTGQTIQWKISSRNTKWTLTLIGTMAAALFVILRFLPLGVSVGLTNSEALVMQEYRGYGDRLVYLNEKNTHEKNTDEKKVTAFALNLKKPYQEWNFSPSGMRYLADINLANFSPSIKQIQAEQGFGFIRENQDRIPLRFGNPHFNPDDIGELLLSSMKLRTLADKKISVLDSQIIRNRMIVADEVVRPSGIFKSNLRTPPAQGLLPTQWTAYMLSQIDRFNSTHVMSLLFFYLAVALYLNSFIRSGIIVIYSLALMSGVLMFYVFMPGSFHVDSLWMLYLIPWFSIAGYFVVCRIIDVERSRGHDRDDVVEEVKVQFAPAVLQALRFSLLSQFALGVLEWIPGLPGHGLWMEAVICSGLGALGIWLMFTYVFPVLYLQSEEFVDEITYKIIKLMLPS